MPNSQFHTAISAARFNRYYYACGNNMRRARRLYRLNLHVSARLYAVIGIFEIVLRNSIDRHFSLTKGPRWLEDAILPGGFLASSPACRDTVWTIKDAVNKLPIGWSHDDLIAKLMFGFWTYRFSKKEFAAAGSTLLQVFINRPVGLHQKDVFKDLVRINDIRNRIAHYEPLCFDRGTGAITSTLVEKRYLQIIDMLRWLGCNPSKILYGIDGVLKVINEMQHA